MILSISPKRNLPNTPATSSAVSLSTHLPTPTLVQSRDLSQTGEMIYTVGNNQNLSFENATSAPHFHHPATTNTPVVITSRPNTPAARGEFPFSTQLPTSTPVQSTVSSQIGNTIYTVNNNRQLHFENSSQQPVYTTNEDEFLDIQNTEVVAEEEAETFVSLFNHVKLKVIIQSITFSLSSWFNFTVAFYRLITLSRK